MIGGLSERMGRPKSELVLGGSTFLERVVAAATDAFADVAAVQRPGGPAAGVVRTIFEEPHAGSGPIYGLARAIDDAAGEPVWIIGVDYPLVTGRLLAALAAQFEASDVDIAVPLWNGLPQYLCAGYGPSVAGRVREVLSTGTPSMRAVVDAATQLEFGEARIRAEFGPHVLINVNEPDEYENLRRSYEEAR